MSRTIRSVSPLAPDPIDGSTPVLRGLSVYLIGIGGCGMSGLARMLQQAGAVCAGSDSAATELTSQLVRAGIPVMHDQAQGVLPEVCDLVIASAAIRPDHPELLAAQSLGKRVLTYAEALGLLQSMKTGISIAGTHGKSTTSAMLAHVMIEAGLDPSFVVGATCPQIGGGARTGAEHITTGPYAERPGFLIAEACEFNRSFHHHRPTIALINNIEADHLDIYGSLDEIVRAFAEFARLIPEASAGGHLLIAHDGAHRREVTAGLGCEVSTFGFNPSANYVITYDPATRETTLAHEGAVRAAWTSHLPGEHMAMNAAAAAILARWAGAEWPTIARALSDFRGLERRMQFLGRRAVPGGGEVHVYDDYGHHPTEIDSTLRALRQSVPHQRLICVFQPHQHSRTRFLLDEFASSFVHADIVIVPHIYFVRDSELEKTRVSSADLVDRLRRRGVTAMHLYPFEAIVEQLEVICRANDLLVIMGAGPVWKVAHDFLRASRA